MIKIHKVENYRDGGTVSVLITDIEPLLLEKLGLPTTPKYAKGNGWIEAQYEIFRDFKINSPDKGKYFFGDINGEFVPLFLNNELLIIVKKLLEEERTLRVHQIDKFLFSF